MRNIVLALLAVSCLLAVAGCPSTESTRTSPPAASPTKEALYQQGHHLYMTGRMDSAALLLQEAAALDSSYLPPVQELGALYFDLGMREKRSKERTRLLTRARSYYATLEERGGGDVELYDRLSEIAVELNDNRQFLVYARKSAQKYPFDRQHYNLGIAHFNVGDFNAVVKTQKEAAARFPNSSYLSSFYRQAGRAYQKMERDRRAIEMFEAGLEAAGKTLAQLRKKGGAIASSPEYLRVEDDRVTMLVLLRKLYRTYQEPEKLKKVEQELKEAGLLK